MKLWTGMTLADLLDVEWNAGNGQCPNCDGMGPVFAVTWVPRGLATPADIGHVPRCLIAHMLTEQGAKPRYRTTPDDRGATA